MAIEKVNLTDKFGLFSEHWSPKLIGQVNDCAVKIAKVKGEFEWHHHENEDELFMVIKGQLIIELRDQDDLILQEGEIAVIPRGVEHRPVAAEETHIMMFEPSTTLNTGNIRNAHTVENLDQI